MSTSRRSVLHNVSLIGILSLTGCTDLLAQTSDQQNSSNEEPNTNSVTRNECTSDIRLKLDSVRTSEVDEASIDPIQYNNLFTGEKQLIESAIGREKCMHPNRRPEIGLLEGRVKQRNDDGVVYLIWGEFYYRIYYENRNGELAS